MTMKKREAQGGAKGKGKADDGRSPEELMCVPPEAVESLIAKIDDASNNLFYDDETVGAFLLLIHSIVYTERVSDRESYLHAAQRVTLTGTPAFQKAAEGLVEEAACALKKGGADGNG
jgi:hypothetical protein